MSLTTIFILAILLLGFLITFQIAKASEYVGILKGEKKTLEQNNRINAFSDDSFPGRRVDWRLLLP